MATVYSIVYTALISSAICGALYWRAVLVHSGAIRIKKRTFTWWKIILGLVILSEIHAPSTVTAVEDILTDTMEISPGNDGPLSGERAAEDFGVTGFRLAALWLIASGIRDKNRKRRVE